MKVNKIIVTAVLLLVTLVLHSQEPTLLKMNTGINSGAIMSDAGSEYKLQASFGQSIVGAVKADGNDAFWGFWSPIDLISLGVDDNPFASQERRIKNFPNPVKDFTEIKFTLESAANVSLKVYNLNGALVAEVFNGYLGKGDQSVSWNVLAKDGQVAVNGTYLYELTADPVGGSTAFVGQYTLRNTMVVSR